MRAAVVLALVAIVTFVVGIGLGEFPIGPLEVAATLLGLREGGASFVVLQLRLPRALVAVLVGVALGVAGALFQSLTRNDLAAPEIIGVAAGANVAAVVVIVALPAVPVAALPLAAFAGALAAVALVYALAWRGGAAPTRLILVGIAVTLVGQAIVTAVISSVDEMIYASQLVVFRAGSVYGKGMDEVLALAPWVGVLVPAALLAARQLDVLGLGDDVARALGARVERLRLGLLAVGAALAGAAVAVAGPVSFVGLMAPHIARRLAGAAHRAHLPLCALVGATMVLVADTLARTAFAPTDIPVGIVTAVVGVPYFVWLLARRP